MKRNLGMDMKAVIQSIQGLCIKSFLSFWTNALMSASDFNAVVTCMSFTAKYSLLPENLVFTGLPGNPCGKSGHFWDEKHFHGKVWKRIGEFEKNRKISKHSRFTT